MVKGAMGVAEIAVAGPGFPTRVDLVQVMSDPRDCQRLREPEPVDEVAEAEPIGGGIEARCA